MFDLAKMVSISGKPGIYKVVANRDNGLVVEDYDNGQKRFISGRMHQFTPLESISIYTHEGTEALGEIFERMKNKDQENPPVHSKASQKELENYFSKILPDYDPDRVFPSDIKKLIKWYNFLNERNLLQASNVNTEKDQSSEESE